MESGLATRFYEMATKRLKPTSGFHDARAASLEIAKTHGGEIAAKLDQAWALVGVAKASR